MYYFNGIDFILREKMKYRTKKNLLKIVLNNIIQKLKISESIIWAWGIVRG
jgi:hypothetical protein